jgi:hypothetical protein
VDNGGDFRNMEEVIETERGVVEEFFSKFVSSGFCAGIVFVEGFL